MTVHDTIAVPTHSADDAPIDFVERARAIASLVERDAAESEREGNVTPEVAASFVESEITWMIVPKELGGGGAGAAEFILAIEEVSRADASSGWSLMANAGSTALAAGYLNDAGIDKLFGRGERPIVAGLFGPGGAIVEDANGTHGSGRFQFGSGSGQASHVAGGVRVLDENGAPKLTPSGAPEIRTIFVPRERVEFLGGWDVLGLRGTGSYDYAFAEQDFDPDLSIPFPAVTPQRGGAVYGLGSKGVAAIGHAGVVLGAMKKALQEVAQNVEGKKRANYTQPVDAHPLFLDAFARNEATYRAARALVLETMHDVDSNEPGSTATPLQIARTRQAVMWAHEAAQQVIPFAHLWSGTKAFREPSSLGRITRDLYVAIQHLMVDPITFSLNAPDILAAWRNGEE